MDNIKYKGFEIEVSRDDYPESPREWDNLGTIICFHKRYTLGDTTKQISDSIGYALDQSQFGNWSEMYSYLQGKDARIIIPIYMYDHSGITINTTGYSCPWDSGQVGYIFITARKIRREYSVKRITSKLLDQVRKLLLSEVTIYDSYLRGDVYGYDIEGIEDGSCSGYFGLDYMISEAQSNIDYHIKYMRDQHYKKVKAWIRGHVSFEHRSPLTC